MIPVYTRRKSSWNYWCEPAQAWTWDVGSYYWYAYSWPDG